MKLTKCNIIFSLILSFTSVAQAERWVIATLEWPPYMCSRCPENGAGAKVLRTALKAIDVEVEFVFLTWSRAVKEGAHQKYVGYYPAWPEDVFAGFKASDVAFKSPLGFIEPKGRPLRWEKLSDLKGKVIGTAQDYGNTVEFNNLVKSGVIKTEVVISDDTNIRKVAAGKLDGAVIDIANAKYYLGTSLKDIAHKVRVNSKILENKDLLVAINGHHANKMTRLNAALKAVDGQKIIESYLKDYRVP